MENNLDEEKSLEDYQNLSTYFDKVIELINKSIIDYKSEYNNI